MNCWTETDERFLLELLATDTVTLMESNRIGDLARAQRAVILRANDAPPVLAQIRVVV